MTFGFVSQKSVEPIKILGHGLGLCLWLHLGGKYK